MNDVTVYLLALTIAAQWAFGIIALKNDSSALINRLMFSLVVVVSIWSFSVLMVTITAAYDPLLFWVRASHATGILIPWHIYVLAVTFLYNGLSHRKSIIPLLAVSLLLFIIAFTPLLITEIIEPVSMKEPGFGPVFAPFFLFYFSVLAYSIHMLYKKLNRSSGLVRMQMHYFIRGILAFILLSTLVNIILPYYGINQLGALDLRSMGPVFSLIMIGAIFSAIIKYRFMDIRFAFRKGSANMLAVLLLIAVMIALFRLLNNWNLIPAAFNLEIIIVAVALTVTLIMPGLKKRAQLFLDERLFKKVTDYRASLLNRIKDMVTLLNLEELIKKLTISIVSDMDLEHGFYCSKVNGRYIFNHAGTEDNLVSGSSRTDFTVDEKLLLYLEKTGEILLASEIRKIKTISLRNAVWQEMKKNRLAAAVPLIAENEIAGIIFLGEKISGEPYYSDDVQLLSILSSQVIVTIKNARLYQDLLSVKHYLEEVLANMGNGLIAVDEAGYITLINSEAEKLIGVKGQSVVGTEAAAVLPQSLHELIIETFQGESGFSDQETELAAGPEKHFLSCSTTVIEPYQSEQLEVIMVMSNITRTKKLEKEKSMAQRLASLGEFAAGIAHEIKNPLVSIKTFADLLPDKYDHPEFRHKFSTVVSQEITRINDLVVELLGFVRETDLYYEPVSLSGIVEEVLLLLSPHLEQQGIRVEREYRHENIIMRLDRTLIKQALLNICMNAVHAMPDKGLLKIGITYEHEFVQITIEDTGIGIPEALKEQVFDPFVTGKANGIGIGLSICHKIISAHRGQISFESAEGHGTRFDISLPLMAG